MNIDASKMIEGMDASKMIQGMDFETKCGYSNQLGAGLDLFARLIEVS